MTIKNAPIKGRLNCVSDNRNFKANHPILQPLNAQRGRVRNTSRLRRDLLPNPGEYWREQGLKLVGGGEWKSAVCPFHNDTKPSLRVRLDSGGFCCMVCGAKGGDVLAYHMQLYGLRFIDAAMALGAWDLKP